jgi:hypothetical protein
MIRAQVTDRDGLAARLPSELVMYLRSQSWAVKARNGSGIQWVKTIGPWMPTGGTSAG